MPDDWEPVSKGPTDWEPVAANKKEAAPPVTRVEGPPNPYVEGDPNLSARDIGQVARGVVSGIAGVPGDIASFSERMAQKVGLFKSDDATAYPTTEKIEKALFGAAKDQRSAGYRELGEMIGAMAGPAAVAKTVKAAGEAGAGAARVGGRLLPGATSRAQEAVTDIGAVSDESILGQKMHADLKDRFNALMKTRQKEIEAIKKDYLTQPHEKEIEVSHKYRAYLDDVINTRARDLTADQKKFISDLKERIGDDPSITRIESERRFINKIAGGKIQGYDAIPKLFAGEIGNNLEKILRETVPESGKFIDAYRKLSAPIDMFQDTLGGRKITAEASPYLPDVPKYDPAVLPKEFFKTKQSVANLKELAGGDEKFVSDAAGEYAASQLKDLSATQARAWANKNKIWLDEVPDVQKEVEKYVTRLEKVSHTQQKAKQAAIGAAIAGGASGAYYRLQHMIGF